MTDTTVHPYPSGVYAIRNTVSGRVYVGSAMNIKRRFWTHRHELARGKHYNKVMQRSWLKHGADKFEFSVLEYVPVPADLIVREQCWIDRLSACHPKLGFNRSPTAGSILGMKLTLGQSAAISEALSGKPKSPEHRAALSVANKGKKHSAETLAAMSVAKKGKPNLWQLGRSHSPETRDAISAALRGKPKVALIGKAQSPEHIAARTAAQKGKPLSPEHRAAISAGQKGKPHAPERRAAISAGRRRSAAEKRAAVHPEGAT